MFFVFFFFCHRNLAKRERCLFQSLAGGTAVGASGTDVSVSDFVSAVIADLIILQSCQRGRVR